MKTLKYISALAAFMCFSIITYSQCNIGITLPTKDTTICAGDSVWLKSNGSCTFLMYNNFDNGTIGSGWSSTAANPVFTNPCGPGPNGLHLWVGTTASQQRTLVTNNYDVSLGGCVIDWHMRYGRVQGSGACEDPDQPNEGVHLQYSTNNGTSWTDFPGPIANPVGPNSTTAPFLTSIPGTGGYWTPASTQAAQANNSLYYWHEYSCTVPAVAATSNTKFRWAQLATSNAGWDAWGIDEVQISCPNSQNVMWSHGPQVFNPTSPVYPTTTTDYIVVIFDSLNNFAYDTVRITVIPVPEPDLGPDTMVCDNGGNYAIFDAGAGYNSYLWNTNATTQTISANVTGYYSVTVTNGNCSGVDSVYLTMTPAPIANAGSDADICYGESTTLTALMQTSASYLWSSGETTNIINVSPTATTTYTVTVSKGTNCYSTDDVVVTVNPLPIADAGDDTQICYGDSVELNASGGANYLWNTGANTSSILEYPLTTTNYYVTVTDGKGCQSSDQVEIVVINLPTISIFTDNNAICLGESATLNAFGANSYLWSTGQTSSSIIVQPEIPTTYSVIGTDVNGCENNDSKLIRVEDCSTFFIPNSFTPDNNGENDYFKPVGDFEGIKAYRINIYNQWGEIIFSSNDIYDKGWDGSFKNEMAQEGVYSYYVMFVNAWDKEFTRTGTVTLLR